MNARAEPAHVSEETIHEEAPRKRERIASLFRRFADRLARIADLQARPTAVGGGVLYLLH